MNHIEKMLAVRAILRELELMVSDHLDSDPDNDLHAITLIKSTIEIYEQLAEEGE